MSSLSEWLEDRPEIIKCLVREYPPGSIIWNAETELFVVAYDESGTLLVSEINPCVDYDGAVDSRFLLCVDCQLNLKKEDA